MKTYNNSKLELNENVVETIIKTSEARYQNLISVCEVPSLEFQDSKENTGCVSVFLVDGDSDSPEYLFDHNPIDDSSL